MHSNLISIHNFCQTKNVYIEFLTSHFLVKDRHTGVTLMHGPSKDGLYILLGNVKVSNPSPIALIGERVSLDEWHNRLRHPSTKITHHVLQSAFLPVTTSSSPSLCNLYQCNKSHCLLFGVSSRRVQNH